jgi:hypothetical protein
MSISAIDPPAAEAILAEPVAKPPPRDPISGHKKSRGGVRLGFSITKKRKSLHNKRIPGALNYPLIHRTKKLRPERPPKRLVSENHGARITHFGQPGK